MPVTFSSTRADEMATVESRKRIALRLWWNQAPSTVTDVDSWNWTPR